VLTSIKPCNIRVIDGSSCLNIESDTYGAKSSAVLESVFGVNSRPNNQVKKDLDAYLRLVNDNKGSSKEGLELRKNLEEWISSDSKLLQADLLMQRNELLNRIK
jgi:hypothetical protein